MNAEKLKALTNALEYIEEHLSGEISQESCARAACCSLSGIQKLFRYVFHISIGDYITRRRLSNAAKDLQKGEISVLEIAVKYGYGSAEAFTRAFSRLWGKSPTAYKKDWKFAELYPRLDVPLETVYEGEIIMKKQFDISELYDYLKNQNNTYVLCFDTSHLLEINNKYGSIAGDKVIVECLRRIDEQCGENMIMFRIGGDEFIMTTGLSDKAEVEAVAKKIIAQNGNAINCDGVEIPVSLKAGAALMNFRNLKYNELFAELTSAASLDPNTLTFKD